MTQRILPGAAAAVIDPAKLRDYCLDLAHPRGRHKARVFNRALGLAQTDAEWLRAAILSALPTTSAMADGADRHGERWRVDLALTRGDRTAIVRTLWLIRESGGPPRLVTCFVV